MTHTHTHTHTHRHTPSHALGRIPLDERSPRRRDLYLTTNDIHTRLPPMLPGEFEPATPVRERPKTSVIDYTTTRIG